MRIKSRKRLGRLNNVSEECAQVCFYGETLYFCSRKWLPSFRLKKSALVAMAAERGRFQ